MWMVPGKMNPGQSWSPHIIFMKVSAFLGLEGREAVYYKGHSAPTT